MGGGGGGMGYMPPVETLRKKKKVSKMTDLGNLLWKDYFDA